MALNIDELASIEKILGRKPEKAERHCFEVMWSKENAYKNALYWLKKSNTGSAKKKEEVKIDKELCCSVNIESNRQNCLIDPYHGAAKGIGKSYRALYTKGVKPFAVISAIYAGDLLRGQEAERTKKIIEGIADHANRIGTPIVDQNICFDSVFNEQPLVNYFSLGVLPLARNVEKKTKKEDLILLVGEPVAIDSEERIAKSSPFKEKILQEAVLECFEKKIIKTAKPIGMGGLVAALSQIGSENCMGISLDFDRIPYSGDATMQINVLTEDKSERVIMVVDPENLTEVKSVLKKWDVKKELIGKIDKGNLLETFHNKRKIISVPVSSFIEGPLFSVNNRQYKKPKYLSDHQRFSIEEIPEAIDCKHIAYKLTENPNIASKRWIYEQYDATVGTNNISMNFPADASLMNLKEINKALAITTTCNVRYVHADPEIGAQIAVAEAARNITCTGAIPKVMANCINAGDPDNPESFWQFVHVIKGMNKAANKFGIQIVDDDVNFGQANKSSLYPVPLIGMVGVLENKNFFMSRGFKEKGDMIFLLGKNVEDIASSEYVAAYHNIKNTPPPSFSLENEVMVQETVHGLIQASLIRSAHSVSKGGLWVSLLESAIVKNLGFDITSLAEIRRDAFLFGESQGRVLISVTSDKEFEFIDFMKTQNYPFIALGHVTKEELRIDDISYGFISDLKDIFESYFEKFLQKK